jgi:hypothetical protein
MRIFIVATTAAAVLFSSPAFTQQASHGTASIPDLSGAWNHPAFPWFEPPASGPGRAPRRRESPVEEDSTQRVVD